MKTAILYIPVIHKGHLEFLKRQKPDALYILGKSLISEFPFLERDMRALDPGDILLEAKSLNLAPDIRILEKDNIDEVLNVGEIVVADDDVMSEFAPKYLADQKVSFDSIFLRWHKMNAVTHNPTNPDRQVSSDDFDREMISAAEKQAEKSSDWWRHVGAILIKDNKVVLSEYNKHAVTENTAYIDGEPRSSFEAGKAIADLVIFQHGEATIIAKAAKAGIQTEGTTLYVTTFPCPTCAMSIANAGIKKVYYKEGYSLLDAERILKQVGTELIQVIDK